MRHSITLLCGGVLLALALGCTNVPVFPDNGSKAFSSSNEFGVLTAQPDTYKGRAVRLAGRMVGIEATEQGTMIMAEWLPFPERGEYGPAAPVGAKTSRFALLYPGTIDPMGTWHGNKFIAAGQTQGTVAIVTLEGTSESIPYMVARCLHVWKTGDSEFESDIPCPNRSRRR